MSVVEKGELADIVPEEWRDKYQDLELTSGKDGHDYLYGIDEEGHKNSRLSWEPLDRSIEETYGIKWVEPYPALRAENEALRLENRALKTELADLRMEMTALEDRLNTKIRQLEARLDEAPGTFDPGKFKKVREWKPRAGEKIPAPVRNGEPDNILTIESVNPDDESATVATSTGEIVTIPLAQLSRYWNVEQLRQKQAKEAATTETSLQARFRRAYDSLLRRHTEVIPTVLYNQDGEVVVVQEEREVEDRRPAALAAVAAGLLLAGFIGYEIGNGNEHTTIKPVTITRTVPKPLPGNEIVIGKNQYKVLLNQEKKLAGAEAKNAKLKEEIQDLRAAEAAGATASGNESLSFRGDTVWAEVSKRLREQLGYTASSDQIRRATGYVLRLNGLRWDGGGYGVDAHRLPVGFRIKIPNNIAAIANR